MEVALLVPLIGMIVWLGKKYITLVDSRIKATEGKLNKQIQSIEHKVTLVVQSTSIDTAKVEIEALRLTLEARIKLSDELNLKLKNVIENIAELQHFSNRHEKALGKVMQIFQSHSNQLKDIYQSLRLYLKR